MKKKTHKEFVEEMKLISPELKIVGEYVGAREAMLVRDEFGDCLVSPTNLLKGKKPNVQSAINKNEYFKNKLRAADKDVEFSGEYKTNTSKLIVHTKYGDCISTPMNLLGNNDVTISSAIDKNSFFAAKASEIHGGFYDYSKVDYVGGHKKVVIVCPMHGELSQPPSSHLQGHACPKCGGDNKYNKETLLAEIKAMYPNVEVLSEVHNASERALIRDEFGVCDVMVSTMLAGKIPSILSAINKTEYFKNKLNKINPGLDVAGDYIDHDTRVIVNTKYGKCLMTPEALLRGARPTISSAENKTQFYINKCVEVHGDKFDYSLVKYKSEKSKVDVICKKHGIVSQTAVGHKLSKHGCPLCAGELKGYSKNDFVKMAGGRECTLYTIKCQGGDEEFYKIGITSNLVKERFDHKKAMPYEYAIVDEIKSCDAAFIWEEEKRLHSKHKKFKYKPKTYFAGSTECFSKLI